MDEWGSSFTHGKVKVRNGGYKAQVRYTLEVNWYVCIAR